MSELISVAFDNPHTAEEARLDLVRLKDEELADLEEAVVLIVGADGKISFHHSEQMTVPVVLTGGFVRMLAGLILINPLIAALGGISGVALGTALGALKDVGINVGFIKSLSQDLKPGSSALLVATRKDNPEIIIEALKSYKGKILQTTLSHRNEAKLRKALEKVRGFQ
jgi:uncharacterized membrane protein